MGLTLPELEQTMVAMGEKRFRGRQLYKWLYGTRLNDFELMTDLTRDLRLRLAGRFEITGLRPEQNQQSEDGTIKFLFRLHDGQPVETVLIPDGERRTVCLSSQSGCALACRFCATGMMGLQRNLTVGEIIGQLMYLKDQFGDDCFTNVVFMGMGEPLQNFRNVIEAVRIMCDPSGLATSARKITVSTSGVTPKIRKLADSGLKSLLALSLHAAIQEKREKIMPVAQTFSLDKLMEAVRYYTAKTSSRVTIEYILFDGFNDTKADIKALTRLLHGIPCKINVLAYNPVAGALFKRPSDEKVNWFAKELYPKLPAVTVRRSRGRDIAAACGQLAGKKTAQEEL